jgi:hypothetical protein
MLANELLRDENAVITGDFFVITILSAKIVYSICGRLWAVTLSFAIQIVDPFSGLKLTFTGDSVPVKIMSVRSCL